MSQKEVIPIFFTVDDRYIPYLGVAIRSLLDNASKQYDYRIIILHEALSGERKQHLKKLVGKNAEIEFHLMKDKIQGITDRCSNRLRCDYFTLTIYFRLFIPAMFPEYKKGIYIDSDIVVLGDISEMYQMELGDNLLGACKDFSIQSVPELVRYTDLGVGVGHEKYINSGVLLMNLSELRKTRLDERFLELLNTYHFDTIAPDQDYLNVMCNGRITYLDECWDAMPREGETPLEKPKLVHYNLFSKPWCYDDVPYEEYFWKYAPKTPFHDEIRKFKDHYSDEQKQSDQASLRMLIYRASEISDMSHNFRTVFNSGKEKRL